MKMTDDELKKLILILCEEYHAEFSEARFKIWFGFLQEFELDDVTKAIQICLTECSYFPRLAEICQQLKLNFNPKLNALEAWAQLLVDLQKSSAGENPITQKIVKTMGGAKHLGNCTFRDLEFQRKNFIELYENYSSSKKESLQLISDKNLDRIKICGF